MVLRIARWRRVRVPVALARIDPKINGHQHSLFRQLLKDFVPPAWANRVMILFTPVRI
jgi:hypothetical protein